jgi:hypothetical protein
MIRNFMLPHSYLEVLLIIFIILKYYFRDKIVLQKIMHATFLHMYIFLCCPNARKLPISDFKSWAQIGGGAQMCSYLCPTH